MKHLIFFSLLTASVLLTVACGNGGGGGDTSDVVTPGWLENSTVVRPDSASDVVTDAAVRLRTTLSSASGADIDITTDWSGNGEVDPEKHEILVGVTNREESTAEAAKLPENGYSVSVVGNKLVIIGKNDECVAAAVDRFISECIGFTLLSDISVFTGTFIPEIVYPEYDKTLCEKLTFSPVLSGKDDFTAALTPVLVTDRVTGGAYVADAVATDPVFGADSTGEKDSTAAIQNAINAVAAAEGGTVWLPAGTYRVTGSIRVKPYVSLVGECRGGDGTGTVIYADVEPTHNDLPALFILGGSAGVKGLTVFYPEQNLDSVIPYPFTFYIPGSGAAADYMQSSIVDVTLVNGYKGILASKYCSFVNEQMYIKNFNATCLHTGIELYNSADASSICDINIAPDVWAGSGFEGAPSVDEIAEYTRAGAVGFVIGDLEWAAFARITATDCETGMSLVEGKRAKYNGIIYSCEFLLCDYGLRVDSMDERSGIGFTRGKIEGSVAAVVNNTAKHLIFTDIEVVGKSNSLAIAGETSDIYANLSGTKDYPLTESDSFYPAADRLVIAEFDRTAHEDASDDLNALLENIAAEGGGIVYLPAGNYLITKPITVPDGVRLSGAGSLPVRDQMGVSNGTKIFASYGKGISDPETAQALFTLGEGSGISNIIITYHLTNVLSDYMANGKFTGYPYMIRGVGDGCYVLNCSLRSPIYGVQLLGADNSRVEGLSSCAYKIAISVENSQDVYIGQVLNNLTVSFRHGMSGNDYSHLFTSGWEKSAEVAILDETEFTTFHMAMDNLTEVSVTGGSKAVMENVFSYCAQTTLSVNDSDADAVNLGRDCYWKYEVGDTNPTVRTASGSNVRVFNLARFNGISYVDDGSCSLEMYTRETIYYNEPNLVLVNGKNLAVDPEGKIPDSVYTSARPVSSSTKLNTSPSLIISETLLGDPVDISGCEYIYVRVFISDVSAISGAAFLELTSSGKCDVNELSWGLGQNYFIDGWNEMLFRISDATETGGTPDIEHINYVRMYFFVNKSSSLILSEVRAGNAGDFGLE